MSGYEIFEGVVTADLVVQPLAAGRRSASADLCASHTRLLLPLPPPAPTAILDIGQKPISVPADAPAEDIFPAASQRDAVPQHPPAMLRH